KSKFVRLEFESGAIVTMNAADIDSAVLAAYGYSYNSVDGLMSTHSIFDDSTGLPSGPKWTLRDGVLTRPSTTSVTGEVVGNVVLEIPSGAGALAGSASLLSKQEFDKLLASYPDERLAQAEINIRVQVPSGSSPQQQADIILAAIQAALDGKPDASTGVSGTDTSSSGASFSGGSSGTPSELAAERARSHSERVTQADTAQQSEYTANQAAKDAARWALIDQNMSQSGAASANGTGSGPGVPAAPGYDPGDVAASEQPGIFAHQGFSNDGRIVPNIFKVVNQDLWTGWGKSSGAEAVLTFPFVLAMSGAVFLPQAVNDIPNIPTLLATALTEWDHGNWGKAAEAAGDGLAAAGMLGEFVAGAEALSLEGAASNVRGPSGPRTTRYDANNPSPPAWPVKNLRNDPRVVIQSAPSSCNAAAAEMVAGAAEMDHVVNEASLLSEVREMTGNPRIALGQGGIDSAEVVAAANTLEAEAGTAGGQSWAVDTRQLADLQAEIDRIGANGPWVAEIEWTGNVYHSVTVVGRGAVGDVIVLDPAGYAYEMTLANFEEGWNGTFISRR
ncbi:MAG: hypothetical protein ACMG6S_18250, partial [Byssovorax sp.]